MKDNRSNKTMAVKQSNMYLIFPVKIQLMMTEIKNAATGVQLP